MQEYVCKVFLAKDSISDYHWFSNAIVRAWYFVYLCFTSPCEKIWSMWELLLQLDISEPCSEFYDIFNLLGRFQSNPARRTHGRICRLPQRGCESVMVNFKRKDCYWEAMTSTIRQQQNMSKEHDWQPRDCNDEPECSKRILWYLV